MSELKNKVVYLHKINGEIVYVGSGSEKRPWHRSPSSRTPEHLLAWDQLEIEIVSKNLSVNEAKSLEEEIRINLSPTFNKLKVAKVHPVTFEMVSEWFYYDPTIPEKLRWRKNSGRNKIKDLPAGYASSKGYYQVGLNNKSYLSHRLIYALYFQCDLDEDKVIDHIDRNTSNNFPTNLRMVTQSENQLNKTHKRSNTGEPYINEISKRQYYQVFWKDRSTGKPMCKYFSFSTKKYFKNTGSYYGSKEEALNAAIMFRNTVVLNQHPQK